MILEDTLAQALAHHRAGRLPEAERLYRNILDAQPQHPATNYYIGVLALQLGKPEAALPHLKVALENWPSQVKCWWSYIHTMKDLGLFDEARSFVRSSASVIPDDPDIRQLITDLETSPHFPNLQGIHAPERQIYMSALVHRLGDGDTPLSILEVGTFMGASMFTWAKAVELLTNRRAEIICVDPWEAADLGQYDDHMRKGLKDGIAHRVFLNTARMVSGRIKVTEMRGMSFDVLPRLAGRTFDIIYIDGCHLYPEVYQDIQACDGLLAEGGFICGDDLEAQLHEVDAEAAKAKANARIDYTQDPISGRHFHPGVTLGVGQFFGTVSVYRGFWVMRKTSKGYEPVSMKGGRGLLPYHWPKEYQDRAMAGIREDNLLAEAI